MSTEYQSELHTHANLAKQLGSLPSSMLVVGSLGRYMLLGETPDKLGRKDGTPRDIDAIDMLSDVGVPNAGNYGPFEVDTQLTDTFRYTDSGWGLFLPGGEQFAEIEQERIVPEVVSVPWDTKFNSLVLPANVQAQLLNFNGAHYKEREQAGRFYTFAEAMPLAKDLNKLFQDFRQTATEYDKYGQPDHPFSSAERIYRAARRQYKANCPGLIQKFVERKLGPAIREVRGTQAKTADKSI